MQLGREGSGGASAGSQHHSGGLRRASTPGKEEAAQPQRADGPRWSWNQFLSKQWEKRSGKEPGFWSSCYQLLVKFLSGTQIFYPVNASGKQKGKKKKKSLIFITPSLAF